MSENDRTLRRPDPRGHRPEKEEHPSGHGIGDVGARAHAQNDAGGDEEPEIRRTSRAGSPAREQEAGQRTTSSGNISETGVGTPTSSTQTSRPSGRISLGPGAGCARTTGTFLVLSVATAFVIARKVRG